MSAVDDHTQDAAPELAQDAVGEEPSHLATKEEPSASPMRTFCSDVGATVAKSLRENLVPATMSFFLGVGLVALYYGGGDSLRPSFEALGKFQSEGGLLFSTVSTGLSAGLIPSVLQATLGLLPRPYASNILFNVVLWSALGCAVNRLYFYQALLFGDGTEAVVIVQKVLFDQFVWNPFMLAPVLFTLFRWRDYKFSCRRWADVFQARAWWLTYCCGMVTCWGTWIPGTCVVYSFPTDLQMPAFNIILMMYSSLLSLVSQGATKSSSRQLDVVDEAVPAKQKEVETSTEEMLAV